jgi:hypothetical protein
MRKRVSDSEARLFLNVKRNFPRPLEEVSLFQKVSSGSF